MVSQMATADEIAGKFSRAIRKDARAIAIMRTGGNRKNKSNRKKEKKSEFSEKPATVV
jgi:hypothetical protein